MELFLSSCSKQSESRKIANSQIGISGSKRTVKQRHPRAKEFKLFCRILFEKVGILFGCKSSEDSRARDNLHQQNAKYTNTKYTNTKYINTKYKIQNTKYKIQNTKYKYKIQNTYTKWSLLPQVLQPHRWHLNPLESEEPPPVRSSTSN